MSVNHHGATTCIRPYSGGHISHQWSPTRWLLGVVFFLQFCLTMGVAAANVTLPPNIVFIMADDLGYGDVGCYGQQVIQTPVMDRLASEGLRCTSCYAGSTVCAPSRCVLMTGLHTGHARVRGNALVPLEPEDITVAEVLKSGGYATGIFGKWGLGEPETSGIPNRQGFDQWFGYLNQRNAHNYYPEYLWRNTERISLDGNRDGRRTQYSADPIMDEALAFIRTARDKPFFLYLAVTLPHANNERTRETGNGMEIPSDKPYSDRDWPQQQKNHAAMITRFDADVGRVMQALAERGIDERTIVFVTSDNGPHREGGADPKFFNSSGPLRGIKRSLTDGGIRVPMIVRWPGKIEANTTSDEPWSFQDFLPTAAELAGVDPPPGIDGISMVPTLVGRPQPEHEYLYWEFHERGFKQAVRMGPWKGIRTKQGKPLELYDVVADIGEQHNVADRHPAVVAKIESILKTARTPSPHWPVK